MIEEKDILAYLDGNSSQELNQRVESWINESKDNRDEFDFTKMMWEESSAAADYVEFDVEEEWSNFEQMIAAPSTSEEKNRTEPRKEAKVVPIKKTSGWKTALSIAASAAVLIFATWWLWPQPEYIEIVNAESDTELLLDDGSIVNIKQGASFKTKRLYKYETERVVDIEGEVNFDIASNRDKPFIVNTEESAVEVLGTVFNVKTEGITSEVANEEGLIKFFVIEDPEQFVNLEPGDVIKYDGEGFIDLNAPEPEEEPEPIPTVREIIDYLRTTSNGRVTFGSGIDENSLRELDIDYEGKSVLEVIRLMQEKAIVIYLNNGCPECIQITEIIPRRR